MKIAWIGTPAEGGGVGGICRLFLSELTQSECALDVFSTAPLTDVPDLAYRFDGQKRRFFPMLYHWDWSAWYGRDRRMAFIMSFLKRLPLHGRIVRAVMAEHRHRPYDVIIQFSQGELFSLRNHVDEVPVILFPCVHAAGELYWCEKEQALSRCCEAWWWRPIRNLYLAYRARLQKRDYNLAHGVIGMSRRFNHWVQSDYGVAPERMGVVYHPIESAKVAALQERSDGRIRLLFVGRISVRKGVELLLQIIPSILKAHPEVEFTIIGAGSLWSDYEALLQDLPTARCRWLKSLPNGEVTEEMRRSDILLIPSQYEPGGIVVGEALAHGMIVVASDEVGSAEYLPAHVCQEFEAGNADAFRRAVEGAIAQVKSGGAALRQAAAKIAQEQFEPAKMTALLMNEVNRFLEVKQARQVF